MPLKTLSPEKLQKLRAITQMPEIRERASPKILGQLESLLEQYQSTGEPFPINRYSPFAERVFGVPPFTKPEEVGGTEGIYSPTEANILDALGVTKKGRMAGAMTNLARLERPPVDIPEFLVGTPLAAPYAYQVGAASDLLRPEFWKAAVEGFRKPRQVQTYLGEEMGKLAEPRPSYEPAIDYTGGERPIQDVAALGEHTLRGMGETTKRLGRVARGGAYDLALSLTDPAAIALLGAGNIGRGVQTALRGTRIGTGLSRGSQALNTFAKVLNTQPGSGAKLMDRFRYAMKQQPIDVMFRASTAAPEAAETAARGAAGATRAGIPSIGGATKTSVPATVTGAAPVKAAQTQLPRLVAPATRNLISASAEAKTPDVGRVRTIVEKLGGKFRGVSTVENSIYEGEPTVYFDAAAGSTKTLPLSKATNPSEVVNKIGAVRAGGEPITTPPPTKRRLVSSDKSFESNKRAIDQFLDNIGPGKRIEDPKAIMRAFEKRAGKLRDDAPKSYAYFRNKIKHFVRLNPMRDNKGFVRLFGGENKKQKFIRNLVKSMPEIEKQAKATGLGLRQYMKDVMYLPDDVIDDAVTKIPIKISDVKPKQFVKYGTTKDIGQVVEVGDDFVRVRFEEGVARYTGKDAEKLLRRVISDEPPDIGSKAVPNVELENLEALKELATKDPTLQSTIEVLNAALREAAANPQSRIVQQKVTKLYRRVIDAFQENELLVNDLPQILEAYGMDKVQFARMLAEDASRSGRVLNVYSQLSKMLMKIMPNSEVEKILGSAVKHRVTPWEVFKHTYKKLDRPRRALLVSQLGTAVRNAYSQGHRYADEAFADLLAGAMQKVTGTGIKGQRLTPVKQDVLSLFRSLGMNKKLRRQVMDALKEFPIEQSRLLYSPTGEASISSKLLRVLNWANVGQEMFYRKLAFDARLTALLERHGKTAADIDFLKKNPDIIKEAVDHALEITYALRPTEGLGKAIMDFYEAIPMMTMLGNPFARFYANSLKYLYDRSPAPLLEFLSKSQREALRGPNSFTQYRKIAKMLEGFAYWHISKSIRESEYAGEKWYQIRPDPKNKNLVIDIRPFAPLSAYFFLHEVMTNPKRLSTSDWLSGILGISRVAGSGLVIVDVIRSENKKTVLDYVKRFGGQIIGAATVPFKTVSDFIGEVDPKERIMRSTSENPLTAPLRMNVPGFIPGGKQSLPEFRSVLRGGPKRTAHPALRQLGVSLQQVNDLEREVNKLGITRVQPRTGDKRLDRLIAERAGPKMEAVGAKLVNNPTYKSWDDEVKEEALKALLSFTKSEARQIKMVENLDLFLGDMIERKTKGVVRKVIKKIYEATPPILPGKTESGPSRPLLKAPSRSTTSETFPFQ